MGPGMLSTSGQMHISRRAASLFVLFIGFLVHTGAMSHSQNLPFRPNFFQQLSDVPRDSDSMDQESSHETASGQQQLMKLLSMKDSLSDLLTPGQVEDLSDPGREDSSLMGPVMSDADGKDSDLLPPENKRVFCNGFTGCGGRFRAQRRQGQHDTDKRVFCNSQGCRNGGRKRALGEAAAAAEDGGSVTREEDTKGGLDMDLWKRALQRLEEIQLGKLRGLSKRVFCNYRGCQNVGKRRLNDIGLLRPRPGSAQGQTARANSLLPRLEFSSDPRQHSQDKRFMFAEVDSQYSGVADALG